jgi:phosphatidate cytidylyltransferase
MLRWRLLLGTLLTAALVGLCWLDCHAQFPGAWLLPVAIGFALLATHEVLALAAAAGLRPVPWPVYAGNLLLVVSPWLPRTFAGNTSLATSDAGTWALLALGAGLILIFVAEIRRYQRPGGAVANIASALFALVYVGLMFHFVVRLRLSWGVAALGSMLLIVKASDVGAYTVGRLIGRHKMAPRLSPGKTIEGCAGALVFAALAAWLCWAWLAAGPAGPRSGLPVWSGWLIYGILLGIAGMLGDLAESLLKRDVGRKDSSDWLPGFGGVLDIVDSLLLAAPVAWACWQFGLLGR